MDLLLDIKTCFLQELALLVFIVLNIFLSLFFSKRFYKLSKWIALIAIVISIGASIFIPLSPVYYAFSNTFVSNIYTVFFKNLILITVFFVILLSRNMIKQKRNRAFEYFTLLLSATLGALCLVSANDFLTTFVSLETLGISCYMLAAFAKNYKAKEAGLKYLIMGSVATAVFLLGVSYLYGSCFTLNFSMINDFYLQHNPSLMFMVACVFIVMGLMFKIGAVPFATWVPDIYEGVTYPVGAFLSLVPKIAGFAILGRVFVFIFSFSPILKVIVAVTAVLSILYGVLGAIRQTNIKRLYGYSSVAHCGYILLGMSVLSVYSLSTVLFYLFCYLFMNIGIWTASTMFYTSSGSDKIEDYKGLLYKRPYYAIAFTTCLLALAGLPPTSGFLAKLYLFSAVTRAGVAFWPALIIALLSTVVSLFFYFKVVRELFEKTNTTPDIDTSLISPKLILYACSLATVLLCIFAEKIIELAQLSAYYI
ncbi:MAG: NADH-quinone oxidoreductase subunit N [Candidatus Gastranaerophilales bacterium]|nr:NADH-quinone oxidoreductase subunit N [Candidatus Gastranaerophilales bacterium]